MQDSYMTAFFSYFSTQNYDFLLHNTFVYFHLTLQKITASPVQFDFRK